jgi:5-methyltetrahydrofolate--homocysteine methyltransferase
MTTPHPNDPLHGITLEMMLNQLVAHYGWEEMGSRIRIRCLTVDPSIKSSLSFLRKTPWARAKVEALYRHYLKQAPDRRGVGDAGGKRKAEIEAHHGGLTMAKGRIVDAVKRGRVLVSDGAWGTFLQQKGLQPGECPELWCVDRPADVLDVARGYVAAGADMVETNSFGGTSFKLEHYGLAGRAAEINQAAAAISRQAAGPDRWVIASVGPTGKMLLMGDVTPEELYASFKEQAVALAEGGADAVCIETMSAIDEAELAIRAAKENTRLEVICTFTCERTVNGDYRTMMGVGPAEAARAAVAAGADIVGTNCGNGIGRMIDIVREIRAALPDTPILVHANAGLPTNIGGQDVFPEGPSEMAAQVPALIAAGADIVGGCCGTTPAHIAAIKAAVAGQGQQS